MIYFIVLLLISFPLGLLRGLVLSYGWEWFLVPLGVPALTYVQAVGVMLVFNTFVLNIAHTQPEGDNKLEKGLHLVILSIMLSLVSWGMLYLWHLLIG